MYSVELVLEWTTCISSLVGSALLAANVPKLSRLAWLPFLGANVSGIVWSLVSQHNGMLVQNIGFTCTTMMGLLRWFFPEKTSLKYLSGLLYSLSTCLRNAFLGRTFRKHVGS